MKLVVRQPGREKCHLVCTKQRMTNGKTRKRPDLMPSEKLFAGEDVRLMSNRTSRARAPRSVRARGC